MYQISLARSPAPGCSFWRVVLRLYRRPTDNDRLIKVDTKQAVGFWSSHVCICLTHGT